MTFRKVVNGHAKTIIGGIGLSAVMIWIGQRVVLNATDQWQKSVADVPVIRQTMQDHMALPIHPGAQALVNQLRDEVQDLTTVQAARFDDSKAFNAELWRLQSATNARLENGQIAIEQKLDRVLDRLPKP